ncbi:type 1 fimbrial protein [Pseudomonas sp. S75]|uniref:fimbrial protein n=1 Tax=unclassified Pseudomonas TaxID=196821 RepID=UPI001903A7E7|nr:MULTISPECIES: fimbrial protein [unclassified Pseudomonas]MBJ9976669.1 type 1 fimbrial protein [Pseudomonas sp. S30]MBK0153671.1 type 1 fimbrial protein [Pseudomonas sp. S75]
MTSLSHHVLRLIPLIGLSMWASLAQGEVKCSGYYGHSLPWATSTIKLEPVTVPPTLAVNQVIAQVEDASLSQVGELLDCDGLTDGELAWNGGDFPQTNFPRAGDMDSGIPGVAIRLVISPGSTGHFLNWPTGSFPRQVWHVKGCRQSSDWIHFFCGGMWGKLTVQLIKTAARTGTGRIGSRHLAAAGFVRRVPHAYNFTLAPVDVRSSGCEVRTPEINVNLGEVSSREMQGVGSTFQAQAFSIGLDCMAETRIRLKLDDAGGRKSAVPDIVSLTEASGHASGVGVQILHGNAPVRLGEFMDVGQPGSAGAYDIALQARYYQTEEQVKPGTANALAFFSLEYR